MVLSFEKQASSLVYYESLPLSTRCTQLIRVPRRICSIEGFEVYLSRSYKMLILHKPLRALKTHSQDRSMTDCKRSS